MAEICPGQCLLFCVNTNAALIVKPIVCERKHILLIQNIFQYTEYIFSVLENVFSNFFKQNILC